MAFPTGWNRRVAITIADEAVTNFDVALTAACFPDEMRSPTDSNRAQSDGGDIRFSSDSAGSNRLACDIIRWEYDTSDGADDADILVRVQVASLSGGTTIYAWYNTAGTDTQPAAGDPYGQHATYHSSIVGYWPLEEDPSGSAPQMLDRTSNANHGTSAGSMTSGDSVAAKVGKGLDFDGSNDYIGVPHHSSLNVGDSFTIEAWVQSNVTSGIAVSKRSLLSTDFWEMGYSGTGTALFRIDADSNDFGDGGADLRHASTMYYLAGTYDGADKTTYVNASSVSTASMTGSPDNTDDLEIGWRGYTGADALWAGKIDEVRLSNVEHDLAYFEARYNNENAPGTFAAPGTPADVGGGGGGSSALNGLLLGVG